MGPVQEMPLFGQPRVQVDPESQGPLGYSRGAAVRRAAPAHARDRPVHDGQGRELAEGSRRGPDVWNERPPAMALSGGQHQAGTCRMGNDPKTSVVDPDCRIHDVDNVYVIDASVHVTNGGFNPGADHHGQRVSGLGPPVEAGRAPRCAHEAVRSRRRADRGGRGPIMVPGASLYYESGTGNALYILPRDAAGLRSWHTSSHRGIVCEKCHGGALHTGRFVSLNNAHSRSTRTCAATCRSRSRSATGTCRR